MKKLLIIFLIASSCNISEEGLKAKAEIEIKNADLAMSDLAGEKGFFQALLQYAEDSVIIPREGKHPLFTKLAADQDWKDKGIIKTISWKPVKVVASQSGDMGYWFGFATFKGSDTATYTNYCTIWRKQQDGNWKFVFDGGNNVPQPDAGFLK
ncbi:MAG TPA: hypothetical protein VD993_09045 [Chitinophagaceae bacterium]|nr:hypothetical protein [Chitinophagaceae bacterium]